MIVAFMALTQQTLATFYTTTEQQRVLAPLTPYGWFSDRIRIEREYVLENI